MKTMKIIVGLLLITFAIACGQEDKTFKVPIKVISIEYPDGSVQTTALSVSNVTWDSLADKPTAFPPTTHTHDYESDITNKPASIELAEAILSMNGVKLPVLATSQIDALTNVVIGTLVFDSTINVLKIYTGVWKVIMTNQ